MNASRVARLAWSVPVLLLVLTLHQAWTAYELQDTLDTGTSAMAEVTRYERSDRKDVTHVELDMPDGSTFEKTRLALPYSIGHRVEAESLQVTVHPGAAQEVVITQIGHTQVGIAWSNAGMGFIAFLMAFSGVFYWNRWQKKA
ncbi:MAG: hypothetical protein O3C45_04565 [Bacteroidetes bacterium]|nr:hypothetical protein [Bacteroidota bacterium]